MNKKKGNRVWSHGAAALERVSNSRRGSRASGKVVKTKGSKRSADLRRHAVAVFIHQRKMFQKQQISALRKYRPSTVYLVADGPAPGDEQQFQRCRQTRQAYLRAMDWKCKIVKIFSEQKLGLANRMVTGLDAIFSNEKFLIVLEDDCCPKRQFFDFVGCVEKKFRKSSKIAAISGSCFLPAKYHLVQGYFFSRYAHCWGWATWRRWWEKYRRAGSPQANQRYRSYFPHAPEDESRYWDSILGKYRRGEIQSWAYGWQEFFWRHKLLSACPTENLVENLGFGEGATNTRDSDVQPGVERNGLLKFPVEGPSEEAEDISLNRTVFENHYVRMSGRKTLWQKVFLKIFKTTIPLAGRSL